MFFMCSDEDVALSDPSEQGDSEEDKSDDVRLQDLSPLSPAPKHDTRCAFTAGQRQANGVELQRCQFMAIVEVNR